MRFQITNKAWYFLTIMIIAYAIIAVFNTSLVKNALEIFLDIIKKIIPAFILVFVLMTLTNYFVKPKTLVKHLGEKSNTVKALTIAIITGIISSGPIYMWYPLLSDLKKQGVRPGLIAIFLYNRAVKIPLLPLIIVYFGLAYAVVLTIVMIFASILQGFIVDKALKKA